MDEDLLRVIEYTKDFYLKRLGLILVFSVPFILASLLLILVSAPTYLALGGVFLRTGSLPELSILDILFMAAAYGIALFIIADTIVNVNIIVRSRRTLTSIKTEVLSALSTYATRIFYIYTLMVLLLFIVQLVTYDSPLQSIVYPVAAFALSFLLFFVAPAVVIDNSDTPTAIRRSAAMAIKNPLMVVFWAIVGLLAISIVELFGFLLPSPFSGYFILMVNSLFVLPFLIIMQTQMYMEKYPLAR